MNKISTRARRGKARPRTVIALLAITVVATAAPAIDAGAASDSQTPTAETSKKKKNFKKKARSYLQGALWSNFEVSGSGYVETLVAFCTNGTYAYRKDDYTSSPPYETYFEGNWSVSSAGKTSATLDYTIENFLSIYLNGQPGPDSYPGSPAILSVTMLPSSDEAVLDGITFSRNPGTC